jgi:hypothetical protein
MPLKRMSKRRLAGYARFADMQTLTPSVPFINDPDPFINDPEPFIKEHSHKQIEMLILERVEPPRSRTPIFEQRQSTSRYTSCQVAELKLYSPVRS